MKVAITGASGFVGTAILNEALTRGHQVKAIVRNPEKIGIRHEQLAVVRADVLNEEEYVRALQGSEAVISAYNPGWNNPNLYDDFLKGAKAVQEGVKEAGIKRFIVVGGAGSLEVAPGVQLVDTPDFPAGFKPGALAARDYLNEIRKEEELDWTFVSPAIEMHQGTSGVRKGVYRVGKDRPVFDEQGRSVLSVEDLAMAIVDELEKPKHVRERFTVAY